MLLTSMTLLPAALAVGSKRRARSRRWTRPHRSRVTGAAAHLVARRPVPVALGAVAVLAVLAAAAVGYHASYDQQPYPHGSQSAAGYTELQRGFPVGQLDPTRVVVTAHGTPPTSARLASFAADLAKVSGVGRVTGGRTAGHGRVTELDVQLSVNPLGGAAFRTVRQIEAVARTRAPSGTTALVGGDTAGYRDVGSVVSHDMTVIFPLAGVAILLILLLMLGALLAPLYLMATVIAGFAASIGATVLVFQGILATARRLERGIPMPGRTTGGKPAMSSAPFTAASAPSWPTRCSPEPRHVCPGRGFTRGVVVDSALPRLTSK